MLKASSYAVRFPNTQHKPRYAYEILFDPFGDFLKTLDRHFGDLNEKHTAALALDKLRQANQEFASYYADFQGLMDILETTGVLSALRQGYGSSHKRIAACENAEREQMLRKCGRTRERGARAACENTERENGAKLRPYARTSACENAESKVSKMRPYARTVACENPEREQKLPKMRRCGRTACENAEGDRKLTGCERV